MVAKPARLTSLDVFRGMTIAAMLLVNNPGLGTAYAPLEHAEWHGWTPTDLIFPFFLFIVGVATPFSLAKRVAAEGRRTVLGHIWIRALSLFMLGELLQGFPFNNFDPVPDGFLSLKIMRVLVWTFCSVGIVALLVPWRSRRLSLWIPVGVTVLFYLLAVMVWLVNRHAIRAGLPADFHFGNGLLRPDLLRIPGVLQRIGICYGVAATIALYCGWRTVAASAVALFVIYSILMLNAPYHDHVTGSLTERDNLSRRIDEDLLNRWGHHAYDAYPDNEGVLSTLPAIGSVLIGILVGLWLRTDKPTIERCAGLLAAGVLVTIVGKLLDWWLMPINKNIWTPSFTVFTAGLGMLTLGATFYFVDVRGRRWWTLPFMIFGANAIAAFIVAGLVTRAEYLIKVHDAHAETVQSWAQSNGYVKREPIRETVPLINYLREHIAYRVHVWSDALQQSSPHFPKFDQAGNLSLAYAIPYVLFIMLLMSVLYFAKIFVKV